MRITLRCQPPTCRRPAALGRSAWYTLLLCPPSVPLPTLLTGAPGVVVGRITGSSGGSECESHLTAGGHGPIIAHAFYMSAQDDWRRPNVSTFYYSIVSMGKLPIWPLSRRHLSRSLCVWLRGSGDARALEWKGIWSGSDERRGVGAVRGMLARGEQHCGQRASMLASPASGALDAKGRSDVSTTEVGDVGRWELEAGGGRVRTPATT